MFEDENCQCVKGETEVPCYMFPTGDEYIIVCRLCGSWYDLEHDEAIDIIAEAKE